MSLKEKLDAMKKDFESKIPADALNAMHQAIEDLLKTGIMERVLKVGDLAPKFFLSNERGEMVSSAEMLKKGPLIINFYRGVW